MSKTPTKTSARPDGRRPLMLYMAPKTIKELKMAALDEDRNAYECVEEAVVDWLKARGKKAKRTKA